MKCILTRNQALTSSSRKQADEEDIWDLCKELEELGGGIQTRLERITSLKLMRKEDRQIEAEDSGLPPYLIIESEASTEDEHQTEQ